MEILERKGRRTMQRKKILHCFEFKIKDVIKEIKTIKDQGFDCIQLSPVQPCKDCGEWWACYQPLSLSIGNKYGTKEDLIELCTVANEYGIKIICDVVVNHMASKDSGEVYPHESVDKKLVDNSYFWREFKPISSWKNRYEVINYCYGLPAFKLDNYDLQDMIINFLNELIDCGVSGFRFDSGKNMALPEEGSDFWIRVLDNLKHKEELFNYAEVILADKSLVDNYCKYVNVCTDSMGSDHKKMITFIESHDSYLAFGYTKDLTDSIIIKEWENLLQDKDWNVLFYCRPFNDLWKSSEIRNINFKY